MGKRHSSDICPPESLTVQEPFDLEAYVREDWWVQEQMVTQYLPKEQNYCVKARYTLGVDNGLANFLGYQIQVENFSRRQDGTEVNSGDTLCARQVDGAKLQVAPCFLPRAFAGPYWVLEFNDEEGWALISGGAPDKEGEDEKCVTGTGTNDSGLWIFTRKQERDEGLINDLRDKLEAMRFDTSVLNRVDNTNCP